MRLAACFCCFGVVLLLAPAVWAEGSAPETAPSAVVSAPLPPKVLQSSGSAPRDVAVPDGKVLIQEEDLAAVENAARDDGEEAEVLEDAFGLEEAAVEEDEGGVVAAEGSNETADSSTGEAGSAITDSALLDTEAASEDTDPSALRVFDPHLAPYGSWVEDAVYGRVWVPAPASVGDEFAPYVTAGRWTLSSAGHWMWLSDHPFGWIVFHYGRWVWSPALGWSWIPGRSYAHAWVVFRTAGYGDTYLGWAPLPPRYVWRDGRAVWLVRSPAAPYVFCPRRAAFEPQLPRYVVRQHDNARRLASQSRRVRPLELASHFHRPERYVATKWGALRQHEPGRSASSAPLRARLTKERSPRVSSLSREARPRVSSLGQEARSSRALPSLQREKAQRALAPQRKLNVQRAAKARDTAATRSVSRSAVLVKRSQAKAAQRKATAKRRTSSAPVRKPRKRS